MQISKLDSIPWILKIASIATISVGILQLFSLFFPSVALGIDGQALSLVPLIIFMGLFHILLGTLILITNKLAIPAILFMPFIQYGVFYVDHGWPEIEVVKKHLILSVVWLIFFICYLFFTKAKLYFQKQHSV